MSLIQIPTLYAALQSEVTSNKAEAEKLLKMAHSGEKADQEAVQKALNAKFSLLDDFFEGKPITEDVAADLGIHAGIGSKSASSAVMPSVIEFQGIENWVNGLGLDTGWMRLFQMQTAEAATEVHVIDWDNKLKHKEYGLGAAIESVPFSTETATRFGRRRFGGGSFADRSLLDTQQRYTISNLTRAHQIAEVKLRTDLAYAAQAAVTPNGTTAYTSSSIIETVNAAYVSLIQAMDTAGYAVTENTPAYLLAHGSFRSRINAAFATIRGQNGNNQILEYPVTPISTFNSNWPTQFGGKDSGMLIVPMQKQIWVNFRGPRLESVIDPKRDGLDLVYQYYLNFQCFGGQCQIVNFA